MGDDAIIEENKSLREQLMQALNILEKVSEPPHMLATLVQKGDEWVDITTQNGQAYRVNYDPRIADELAAGATVRLDPQTMAVVAKDGDMPSQSVVSVKDVYKDGRVQIEAQGRDIVVNSSVKDVKVGDYVCTDHGHNIVVGKTGAERKAFTIDKVPEVPWSAIGGLDQTIEDIQDAIELPYLYRDLIAKFPNKKPAKGILLYGPPGCGKTMIGKGIAYNLAKRKQERDGGELNGHFLYAAGPEFLQKYVGTGEEKVRAMFANARETAAKNHDPVVIFIDEPEAVLRHRGSGVSSDAADSIVNQFLVEMDGLNSIDDIVLLFATNRQELLDPALIRPGRVDRKIHVPRPNKEGAAKIFELYLANQPLATNGLDPTAEAYAGHAACEVYDGELPMADVLMRDGSSIAMNYGDLFSGASVVSIVNRATDYAFKRGVNDGPSDITKDDMTRAVGQEYHENRMLVNAITRDDLEQATGGRLEEVLRVQPHYAH